MITVLLIGLGGFLGAICRYLLTKSVNSFLSTVFIPFGTIIVNIIGSFVLAFLLTYNYSRAEISQNILLFLGAGFLGAFTTFSTFTYETLLYFQISPRRGIIYFLLTIISGYGAAVLGYFMGKTV
ncbi:MAG: fluoride efflux transporter CrcB [Candidatus Cloacimonetes bacterium]|nr:fluoride efflux transporter CrcB [Candidatus Cloacimonadota bacterium]